MFSTRNNIMPLGSGDGSSSDDDVLDITIENQALELGYVAGVSDCGQSPCFMFSFAELSYSVKNPEKTTIFSMFKSCNDPKATAISKTKMVLDSVSGEAREGKILAVLGASGSGKSTLIDALANRIARDSLKGSIKLNGEPLDGGLLNSISAYVLQDDLLFPMLTVEETLMFSAEFRLPRSLPTSQKKARVRALIDQLGLHAASKTIIGNDGHRGVSGGERRRVSIGVDIVHDPIILFLDEPTSGLDSTSAFMVVKVLKRIAESGSIVIMSVHQPSSRILGLLDHLIILSQGQTAYYGAPDEIFDFFSKFGSPVPENENRAEFALDLIRELESSSEGAKALVDFNKSWTKKRLRPTNTEVAGQTLKAAIGASISCGKLVCGATGAASPTTSVPAFANPLWIEMAVLTKRSFTNVRRTPELFIMRLGTVLFAGLILSTIFWRLDESPKGVQERLGFFIFSMSTMLYTCADSLPVFLLERYIFMRETAYNAYRPSSYVLANTIAGLPLLIILPIAFSLMTFFSIGLAGGAAGFFFYFLIIFASFWAGSSFVTFLSAVVSHVMMGYVVMVAFLGYFLVFSGFFINRDRIPNYWLWFHYISLVKYPYEAVMQNEFNNPGKCFVNGLQMFDDSPLRDLPAVLKTGMLKAISKALQLNITSETCLTTGPDILKQQGITDLSKWSCLWIVMTWGFFFRVLFYFALLLGSKNKRR